MARRLLARLGFVATGVLYVVMGWTAARVAVAGARDRVAGFPGALRALLRQPHGPILVGAVAAGLAGFALWHLLEARRRGRTVLQRVGHIGSLLGYAALAATGASVALGGHAGGGRLRRSALEWLLSQAWGPAALSVAGVATIGIGIVQIFEGASGRLRNRFATRWLSSNVAGAARAVARFGLAARGVVLLVIGYFQIRVARDLDPRELREIGGALRALSRTPVAGSVLLGVAAAGLAAYGVYMGMLAIASRR